MDIQDRILLMGSCFTSNVGELLRSHYFDVLYNPVGILFDPSAIQRHLHRIIHRKWISEAELFEHQEIFSSWEFHSDFSSLKKEEALRLMKTAQEKTYNYISSARFLVLTLGSAFRYKLHDSGLPVANCHKVPASSFYKELLDIPEILNALKEIRSDLDRINPACKIMITVSPVRHIRDGVVENNRSKARLLEAVHSYVEEDSTTWYFPAYEYVIDVLRDYRFYDIDMVHPNYLATQEVFDLFCRWALNENTFQALPDLKALYNGMNHRPRFPETQAHREFLHHLQKKKAELTARFPCLIERF